MAATFATGVTLSNLLNKIADKLASAPLTQDIDLLSDAIEHTVRVLRPANRNSTASEQLLELTRWYKQCVDMAIEAYNQGQDFGHFYDYILDIAYEIAIDDDDETLATTFTTRGTELKEVMSERKRQKKKNAMDKRNEQLRELALKYGIPSVGHSGSSPPEVYCFDVHTHKKLDPRKMLIRDIDHVERDTTQTQMPADTGTSDRATLEVGDMVDPSIPPPATNNPFGEGFVNSETVDNAGDFKVLRYGTVYGFALAPDKTYSMVFAVQFSPTGSFSVMEQQAVDAFAEFVPKAAKHAYEVKGNKAQNAGRQRRDFMHLSAVLYAYLWEVGKLWSTGWRPGRTEGEMFGEYTAQSTRDKHDPDGYVDLYEMQEVINAAWIILQERLSPRAVMTTMETLADTAVPLFGSHDSDLTAHGPSLGSNMAVSRHDKQGNGFANAMHVDRDIDSLPKYYGKVFTFGQWLHLDKHGKLVDSERIKEAIPDGYFILPGYRIAIDLGAAAVVTAIWRGGMDLHGTTTSTVKLDQGITRWGMSIQTNRNLPARLRLGRGKIFGLYDRLRGYYDFLTELRDAE